MYNPEQAYIASRSLVGAPLNAIEEDAYNAYLQDPEMMEKRKRSISMQDMDEFSEKYNPLYIEKDKRWLKEQRDRDGQMDKTPRAELLEYFFETMVEGADWFGENVYLTKTLEFDDRMNHTDFVLEWEGDDPEKETIKLAVDCTVAENKEVLQKKVDCIMKEIERETLTSVKYFHSSGTDEKGPIKMIPRVIIGLRKNRLEEICKVTNDIQRRVPGSNKKLSESYLQLYLLREMELQLKNQLAHLEIKQFKNYTFMKKSITDALKSITDIVKEKESSLGQVSVQRAYAEPLLFSSF